MSAEMGAPYGTPQNVVESSPAQQGSGQLPSTAPGLAGGDLVNIDYRAPVGSGERNGQTTAMSEGLRSLTRSQATMEEMLDSSEDETSDNDRDDSSSEDEPLEDAPAKQEAEDDFDLEDTMNMLRQVNLIITRDDTLKKKEEMENLTAVLCFLDRGLSTPQVQEWAELALTKAKRLKIISITAKGSRNSTLR